MAEQGGITLKRLFADVDDQERRWQQDMDMQPVASSTRKKGSRSPLRARAQQSSNNSAPAGNTDLDNSSLLLKSPRTSPDQNLMQHMMMKKKDVEGSPAPPPPYSYTNPTFISKPTTLRDHWPSTPAGRPHRDRESNDGTHLIRLLADFIEEFQFGSTGKEQECASLINDPKSLPVESRHSHQLAGQLRRLADAFEKENTCLSFRERRIK